MTGDGALTTAELDAYLTGLVDSGALPHVTAIAASGGEEVYRFSRDPTPARGSAAGNSASAREPVPLTPDSVIWLASMTKLVIAVAALQQVERGTLKLDAPLTDVLPDAPPQRVLTGFDSGGEAVTRPPRTPVTLRHLLSHSSGYAYNVWEPSLARYQERYQIPDIFECREITLTLPLTFEPGTSWAYGMGLDFIGKAIERVSGQDLETYLREHVLGPLGMSSTSFDLSDDLRARLTPLYQRTPEGFEPLEFEVPQDREFYLCGAGLYGSPADYLRLLRALVNLGTLDRVEVLRPETVLEARQNQIGPVEIGPVTSLNLDSSGHVTFLPRMGSKWSLLGLRNENSEPNGRAPGSTFWAGMANCYYWGDWEHGDAGLLCTQVMPFADQAVLDAFDAFETAIHALSAGR